MTEPRTDTLRRALTDLAERMPPARVPEDLWTAGRRRHRRRIAAAGTSLLAVLLAVPLAATALSPAPPPQAGADTGAVPARLHQPWPWQGTVQQSPSGRAAVLVSGGGRGLASPDLPGAYGSKIGVVGRDGSYRMLRFGRTYQQAGQDVLLSPDGRYVAGDATLEDLLTRRLDANEITVVDLETGAERRYRDLPAGRVVAWSPDGGRLLLWQPRAGPDNGERGGRLWLLDRATGKTRALLDLGYGLIHPATFVAFSPDGRQVAVQVDQRLIVVGTTDGSSRTLTTLQPGTRLGGAAAWADPGGIMVFTFRGCTDPCTDAQRNDRRWGLVQLNASTGSPLSSDLSTDWFPEVTGAAARIVGWLAGGEPVVVRYLVDDRGDAAYETQDEPTAYRTVRDVELLALRRGGGSTRLVETPAGQVWGLDVARDLIADSRFGGPSPQPSVLPAAPWLYGVAAALILPVAATLAIGLLLRRRRAPVGAGPGAGASPKVSG